MNRNIDNLFYLLINSLKFSSKNHILSRYGYGAWLSLVERYVRDVEVASSNPVAPTK